MRKLALDHLNKGRPLKAAACHLAINDPISAVIKLLRSQNLYLAYIVAKLYNLPEAMRVCAFQLAQKAEIF